MRLVDSSRHLAGALAIVTAMAVPAAANAQATFGSAVLSPRVAAAYVIGPRPAADSASAVSPSADDRRPLIAIVLWRGQTGWLSGPPRGIQPPKNVRENTARLMRVGNAIEHRQWVGGHDLRFRFDAAAKTVEVLGRTVPLKGPTVILVDNMDNAGGGSVLDVVPLPQAVLEPRLQQSTKAGEWSKLPSEVLMGDLERQPKLRDFLK